MRLPFLMPLTLLCCAVLAAEPLPFDNPGLESDADGDSRPDAWVLKVAEPGAVAIDSVTKHSGAGAVRIRHENVSSYSYVMQELENTSRGQRFIATVWIKCQDVHVVGIGPRLYCGYEGGLCHAARGPELDASGSCDWQKLAVPFNTRDKARVAIYLYLHEASGTVWFDGLSVVPAPFEVAVPSLPIFPEIDGSPDDAAWDRAAEHGMVWTTDGTPAPGRRVKLAHDAGRLYALVTTPAPGPDQQTPGHPRLTLAIDPEAEGKRHLTFCVRPDEDALSTASGDVPIDDGWAVAIGTQGRSTSAEFAIPLEALRPTMRTGRHWRINVVDERADGSTAELIFTGMNPFATALFADARLAGVGLNSYRLAELKTRLTALIDEYEELADSLNLDTVPDRFRGKKEAQKGLDKLGRRLEQFSRDAMAADTTDDAGWRQLDDTAGGLSAGLKALRSQTMVVAAYALVRKRVREPKWSVLVADSTQKVMRDKRLLEAAAVDTIEMVAARGEAEAAQLVIVPLAGDVREVSVKLPGSLRGPGGAGISRSAFELNWVGHVRADKPAYDRPVNAQWWPDVLLPYAPADVKQQEAACIWLTLHVPREAQAGIYNGRIVVSARGMHNVMVKLRLRVYGFELPARPALRTSFGLGAGWLARYYFGQADARKHIDAATYRKWCDELLRHRVSPYLATEYRPEKGEAGEYQYEPWEGNIAHCMTHGLTSMMLGIMPRTAGAGPDYDEAFKLSFARDTGAAYSRLQERGWLDTAYMCAWDEPRPALYEGVLAGHRLCRKVCPDLKILQTVCFDPEPSGLVGDVDIWCPITSQWNPEFYGRRRQAGEQVWWYVCCSPHPPYANFFIDCNGVDHRILFWQTWQQGVQGLLYWQTTWWEGNIVPGGTKAPADPQTWVNASYTPFKVNGDGQLLYPGADLEPLASLRLAIVRDGIEDYDYLALLRDLVQDPKLPGSLTDEARPLLKIGPDISRSLTGSTTSGRPLQKHRRAVAEMIETLSAAREKAHQATGGAQPTHREPTG